MKRLSLEILLVLLTVSMARADTPVTIGGSYACFDYPTFYSSPPTVDATFNLPGGSGNLGVMHSVLSGYYEPPGPPTPVKAYIYGYSIDLSGMAAAGNHCLRLIIHFGSPESCFGPAVNGDSSKIQSATLAAFGDVTFVFSGGCLEPGHPIVGFQMVSGALARTNIVTIIDDFSDPASGQTNETRINVPAIVPDIPPNPPPWAFAPPPLHIPFLQGAILYTNPLPPFTNRYGTLPYDFKVQLYNAASNGIPVSQIITQTEQVVNGIFHMPLPFEPAGFGGNDGSRWVGIAIRPSGSNVDFTPLNPPLPITPAPQALYAFTAGSVADLGPGQAVTSLNGLSDSVNLQAGSGIFIGTNGNTLTISAVPGGPSDRNLKTDFAPAQPEQVLERLSSLPIEAWRYTNEAPGIRHLGPMAQDFKAAFGLGSNDKIIGYLDASGVALTAIKGLNQKVNEKDAEIEQLKTENESLEKRVDLLEQRLKSFSEK